MKKSSRDTKGLDSPEPDRDTVSGKDKQELQTAAPNNISRERISDGASTTTEVLSEILQRHKAAQSVRHWGINE
jgi:hypothetical protein